MDYLLENYSTPQDMQDQLNAIKHHDMSDMQAAREFIEGGSLLCYHSDVKDFLNSLDINPDNREYSNQQSWDLYIELCAREIIKYTQGK